MPPPILSEPPRSKLSAKKSDTSTTTSILVTFILFSPVLFLFFLGGVYFGSSFSENNVNQVNSGVGIPGTRNIIEKWNSNNLRGSLNITKTMVPPLMQNFLRHELIHEKKEENNVVNNQNNHNLEENELIITTKTKTKTTNNNNLIEEDYHPITGSEIGNILSLSMHIQANTMFRGSTDLDSTNLIIGVWIYLDELTSENNNMRTIFTNKKAGCENSKERYGIAMYVNEWGTNNHQLYVEYGNTNSGCNKVFSDGIQLISHQWYHVALSMVNNRVELFIDGTIVSSSQDSSHSIQPLIGLSVGSFHDGEYPLFGNISHLCVAHLNSDNQQLIDLQQSSLSSQKIVNKMMNIPRIVQNGIPKNLNSDGFNFIALYKFDDFDSLVRKGSTKTDTYDVISQLPGKYFFPEKVALPIIVVGVPIKLVTGLSDEYIVTEQMKKESDVIARIRREEIKKGMEFVWSGYKKHAWGYDELKPMTNSKGNPWGGMGVTLVDSLDTLWVMGMKTEFYEAVEWVRKSLSFDHIGIVSVFETTIRELGGLLSAYDLSGEKILLDKAEDLGSRLIHAFDGGIGLPRSQIDLGKKTASNGWSGNSAILSEIGTLQVEFRYLSYATNNHHYEDISMNAIKLMGKKNPRHGLYPIKIGLSHGEFTESTITFGALGDSFYEYLLKLWLQGNKEELWLRNLYDRAIDGVINVLLKTSSKTGLAFLSDWDGVTNDLKMDHLVCFMPGIMTLGAYTDPEGLQSERAQRDLNIAKALMYTCREMYHRTKTGIAPEFVRFDSNDMNTKTSAPFYILRPETAESLYVMNHLTGDPIYREWAWEIWTAIDKNCRVGSGYGSLHDVNALQGGGIDDRMESFFLAETMKYLYLAQDPDSEINLMEYVFNTEAHPTKIFKKGTHIATQLN